MDKNTDYQCLLGKYSIYGPFLLPLFKVSTSRYEDSMYVGTTP